MSRPDIGASWEANAEAWTSAVREGKIASRRAGTDAAIRDAVRRARGRRVLDVGCGEGWLARALSPDGFDVTGLDGSSALIGHAREAGGGEFIVLTYEEMIAEPTLAGGPHDVAVLNFALLADHIAPLLAAIRQVLVPDGVLVIQTLHPVEVSGVDAYVDGWRTETFSALEGFVMPMPWFFRTLASWSDEIRDAGFAIERIEEPLDPVTQRPLSLLLSMVPYR